jgi:excisionase family DNA binding protein
MNAEFKSILKQQNEPLRKERLLLTHHAARRLGVKPRTVRWLVKMGRLPAVRIGMRAWGFHEDDIEAYRYRREVADV